MNLDEQFLEMTDKIRLIKLENENVTPFSYPRNLKRRVKTRLFEFREYEMSDTFSLSSSISLNLLCFLKLFITLFITRKVEFKSNSKGN